MECRRCGDCRGMTHHWMENPDFGNDPSDAEHPVNVTHLCKHCDATGSECERCEGQGMVTRGDEREACPDCGSEGVIAGAMVEA